LIDNFWDVILWMLAFFVFAMFFWLFVSVLADLWSDPDTGGGAKAFWTFFIVILPWLGILIYLIARGGGMAERAMKKQQAQEEYIRKVAGSGSSASELAALSDLKAKGDLTQEEFNKAKASLLG
jgi:TRAP-type C4-dicarboxylate transport system permease small subunit